MTETHIFEHPLNEKTRIYLRVEALLDQLKQASHFSDELQYLLFFRSLFDLMEIFEQIQLKSELAKDIEKQRLVYRSWLHIEDVDQSMLAGILSEVDYVHSRLMGAERFGQSLKEDRFLSAIRQRFNLPGGSCCFDLPTLYHWLHLPAEHKIGDSEIWINTLQPLYDALQLWLRLSRETGHFQSQNASSGFYQSDAEDANILRLDIPIHYGVYPMISGHKNRFAIKFIHFDSNQSSTDNIQFRLAVCN